MKSILGLSILLCILAVAIATPHRRNEEVHLKSSSVDILRSQESRWDWGDRGVGGVGFETRGEAAGIAAAGNFDVDGFGGRRDIEIEAAREAGADFAAGGFGGGW